VPEAGERKMSELEEIRWSEVIRKAMGARIGEEEAGIASIPPIREGGGGGGGGRNRRTKVEGWESLPETRKRRRSHVDGGR